MNLYRVEGGPAQVGPGQRVGLDEKQYAARAHNMQLLDRAGGVVVAEALVVQTFKVGEEVYLAELPKNLVDVLVPVGAPASKTDELALERSVERQSKPKAAVAVKPKKKR